MMKSINRLLRCTCGTTFRAAIYQAVNVAQEPHLQYTVLAGLLNVVTCPNCRRKMAVAQPFVYQDASHGLFVYVHPQAQVSDQERQQLLTRLREAALTVKMGEGRAEACKAPLVQVAFGIEALIELIRQSLPLEETLGKLALNTRNREPEARQRLRTVASEMARQMGCQIEEQEEADEYIVWLYGPRRSIGAIMGALVPRH